MLILKIDFRQDSNEAKDKYEQECCEDAKFVEEGAVKRNMKEIIQSSKHSRKLNGHERTIREGLLQDLNEEKEFDSNQSEENVKENVKQRKIQNLYSAAPKAHSKKELTNQFSKREVKEKGLQCELLQNKRLNLVSEQTQVDFNNTNEILNTTRDIEFQIINTYQLFECMFYKNPIHMQFVGKSHEESKNLIISDAVPILCNSESQVNIHELKQSNNFETIIKSNSQDSTICPSEIPIFFSNEKTIKKEEHALLLSDFPTEL